MSPVALLVMMERGEEIMAIHAEYSLSGATVCRLMRRHGITIRALAQNFTLTMKRVREVRAHGVSGFAAIEWHFMITGVWPDGVKSG